MIGLAERTYQDGQRQVESSNQLKMTNEFREFNRLLPFLFLSIDAEDWIHGELNDRYELSEQIWNCKYAKKHSSNRFVQ